MKKVDILAIGAHPDDIELSCAGTLLAHAEMDYTFALLDLTRGEMGTRGTPETRAKEAENAKNILGAEWRANVGLRDGFFEHNSDTAAKLIPFIRASGAKIVLANTVRDRHPDHGRAASLIHDACFLAGLAKIETTHPQTGKNQERHRPQSIYHYMQDFSLEPDLVVDIKDHLDRKMESIAAYKTQFHQEGEEDKELSTPISGLDFMSFVKHRARVAGRWSGFEFAEAYKVKRPIGTKNLMELW